MIVAAFAVIFGVLALGYFLFLRSDYVAVFSQVRPAEASAIVSQLESKTIAYRLADGGTTILVPADQADQARVAIGGSDIALKGGVGFELFNKSDMGLTDFAQRINYQRALQGELERSIMMLDDIESARVHLAMPERTIFRSERSNAKAAVELVAKPGRQLDDARVAGIQRLVSFAVPDLTPADVVVLDSDGRVLSASSADGAALSPDAEERQGVQGYYRARARSALQLALPGVAAEVKVIALGSAPSAAASGDTTDAAIAANGSTPVAPATRNFRLRVIVATATALSPEDQSLAHNAIVAALTLQEAKGDELAFQIGLGPSAAEPTARPTPIVSSSPGESSFVRQPSLPGSGWPVWLAAAAAMVLVAGALILWRLAPPTSRLSRSEREAMIDRVRRALREADGSHVAA
jgi:flagellar M-ring protein FliF